MTDPTPLLDRNDLLWFRRKLRAWAKNHLRDFPWRHTTDPYAILVAECLLQKTTAEAVAPVYTQFLAPYPDLPALLNADRGALEALLAPLGLKFRAERLLSAATEIRDRHRGQVPDREADLLALTGVGSYTARAILAVAFGRRAAVMDTNVARILERFFGIRGERVKSRCKRLWAAADEAAPNRDVARWNLTLLDLGALVCTARSPRCEICPLAKRCRWRIDLEA